MAAVVVVAAQCILLCGCGRGDALPDDQRTRQADAEARRRWGKSLDELPLKRLVIISPHNENIRMEYEWAFSLHQAVNFGHRVYFEWRTVGGGGSSIDKYLKNVYESADSSGIDILWGGGDYAFKGLAEQGVLQPMRLAPEVEAQIPPTLGAVEFRDRNMLWCGAAISAFGYLYNKDMLARCGIESPDGTWDDLGEPRFADMLSLADPTQSGSAAAAYLLIAGSAEDWPQGWAKLLRIMCNARQFVDSAGSAANAPVLGEALVATCIDFYGAVRVAEAPDKLVYVSPAGQTAFSPDPIGILKNPPDEELAQQFVDFVLSSEGQALLAVRVGQKDGPARNALCRQPIRRDVYESHADQMLDAIVNPYRAGQVMVMTGHRTKINYEVLKQLVRAAGIDNVADLRAARAALAKANYAPHLMRDFQSLPPNIDSIDEMASVARALKDETQREIIITDWTKFFRQKYRRIASGADE